MSADDAAAVLARAHQTIREGAETSKRAISAHRRALKAQTQALETIERECERLGIRLVIEHKDP